MKGHCKNASSLASALAALIFLIALAGCQSTAPVRIPEIENKSLSTAEEYIDIALKNNDLSTETLLILVENYFDEESTISKDRFAAYEEQQRLYLAGKLRTEPSPPTVDHSRLIAGLRSIEKRFADNDGMDGIVYTLGYALFESARTEEAIAVFSGFLKKYGASRFATEVNFRLAELYFDEGRLIEAEEAYSMLLKRPASAFHPKSVYKLGWTHYRLDEYGRAFSYFIRLVDAPQTTETEIAAAETLGAEAENDAIKALTHLKATEIENTIAGIRTLRKAPDMTFSLGKTFFDQGRTTEAIFAYELFLKLFATHKDVPRVYIELARTADTEGDKARSLATKEKLISTYGPSTAWYKANSEHIDAEMRNSMADNLMDLGDHYRMESEKNPDALKTAIDLYALFVANFGTHSAAETVRYNLAEALFETGRYLEAAIQYSDLTLLLRNKPEGEAAAFTSLIALELAASSGKPFNKALYKQTANDVIFYHSTYHKDKPRAEEFVLKAADVFSAAAMYAEAKDTVIPMTKGASSYGAFIKLGDINAAAGDVDSALDAYEKAYAVKKDALLTQRLASMHYLRALEHEKLGAYDEALGRYLRAFELGAPSKTAEDALLRAARIHIKREDREGLESALNLGKRLMPLSGATYTIMIEDAANEEGKGNLRAAAGRYYEASNYAAQSAKTVESDNLTIKTASLYNTLGDYPLAKAAIKTRMAQGGLTVQPNALEGLFVLAEAEEKSGDLLGAKKTYTSILASNVGGARGARARLALTEIKLKEYLEIKITEPVNVSIKKKEALMNELLDEYAAIAKEHYAELLPRVFYSMGAVFENYGASILNSARPKDLTEEEAREYDFLLEEKTFPIEEEAVKAYKSSLKSAASLSMSAEAALPASLSLKKLEELRPAAYLREVEGLDAKPILTKPELIDAR